MKHNRVCLNCNRTFVSGRSQKELDKGWGKCCSYKCMGEYARTGKMFNCQMCNKSFYRKSNEISSGFNKFCSLQCNGLSIKKFNNYKVIENVVHMRAKIVSSQEYTTILFDLDQLETMKQYNWMVDKEGYARTRYKYNTYKMHQLVLGKKPGFVIDHKDNNRINNTINNLRHATTAQNSINSVLRKDNKTGYRGVSIRENAKLRPYRATISHNHRSIVLGNYETPEQAAIAYNKAAAELHGEFAKLNQVKKE